MLNFGTFVQFFWPVSFISKDFKGLFTEAKKIRQSKSDKVGQSDSDRSRLSDCVIDADIYIIC